MPETLKSASYLGDNTVALFAALCAHLSSLTGLTLEFDASAARSSPDAAREGGAASADLVWACGLLTGDLIDAGRLDAEIVAAPVFVGQTEPVYHSVIVCRQNFGAGSLADAAGGRLAINERESWSGHHGLVAHLRGIGTSIDTFSEIVHTGSHRNSVAAIRAGDADVAAIDNTVWDHLVATTDHTVGLTVIEHTADWPAPPFSLRRDLETETRNKLRNALVSVAPGDIDGLFAIVPASRNDYRSMTPSVPPGP